MSKRTDTYSSYRYPIEIISHAVWLYFRFTLSFRNLEEILAYRGVIVSHETVRLRTLKFGQTYANAPVGDSQNVGIISGTVTGTPPGTSSGSSSRGFTMSRESS